MVAPVILYETPLNAVNKEKAVIAVRGYRLNCNRKVPEFSPKISMYGLTCRRCQKTGTFSPANREECACTYYHENARFREDLRENKRKSEVRLNLRFWSE